MPIRKSAAQRPAVILLVEDDPGDQELTRRALAGGMYRPDLRIVSDGEMALEYLRHRGAYADRQRAPGPDLILLDLNMPRLDGRNVLRAIKADESLRGIPVVVFTTSQHEQDVVRSYNLGCNSFITKPVMIEGFIRAVRNLHSYWFELVTHCHRNGGDGRGAAVAVRGASQL